MTPLVFALDTTREYGSLALLRGPDLLEEVLLHAPTGFAHVIYPEIAALLGRQNVRLAEISCFAAASGPGSFTGVRVGLACIKGLAEAMGKPAVALSNLRAISTFGGGGLRATVLDARRGEIYGALYDAGGRLVSPEVVSKLPAWLASLPRDAMEFVTGDPEVLAGALAGTPFESTARVDAPRALAAAVARLALDAYEQGQASDPAALDANYVRRSDAELFWKE
jgi:tRNA threonylcarbamoyladenosine biosynthesis protein TsaB